MYVYANQMQIWASNNAILFLSIEMNPHYLVGKQPLL